MFKIEKLQCHQFAFINIETNIHINFSLLLHDYDIKKP